MAHFPELLQNAIDFARSNRRRDLEGATPWQCPKSPWLFSIRLYVRNRYGLFCCLELCRGPGNPRLSIRIVRSSRLCVPQFPFGRYECLCCLVEEGTGFFAPHRVTKDWITQNLCGQGVRVFADRRINRLKR